MPNLTHPNLALPNPIQPDLNTGEEAFAAPEGMERKELYANIKAGLYDTKRLNELRISTEAQDLLAQIFTADPKIRLSAEECMKHNWVNGEGHKEHHRVTRLASVSLLDPFGKGGDMSSARRPSALAITEGRRRSSLAATDYLTNLHAGQHTPGHK